MKLHLLCLLLGAMILHTTNVMGQAPLRIPYQAVLRSADGIVLSNQPALIKSSVVFGEPMNTPVFTETHTVVSSQTGIVSIVLGDGQSLVGNIDEINWNSGIAYLKIEIDYQNSGSYILVGVSQILSVPYALESGNSLTQFGGSEGQIITHDGNVWLANNKVWVNSLGVVIDGLDSKDPQSSIFSIKNADGQSLFNINEKGVEVLLQDQGENQGMLQVTGLTSQNQYLVLTPDSARVQFNINPAQAEKGGFAIGGLSNGKSVLTPYFLLDPTSTQLNFDKMAAVKAAKGGFAIGGLSTGKGYSNLFSINPDSTRFYLDTTQQKAAKGGFAIGGLSNGKTISAEFFRMSNVGAQLKFDESAGRAAKGGFAIGGLSTGKTGSHDYLAISELNTTISMVETDQKNGVGGFAIGGYQQNEERYKSFFRLNSDSININTGNTIAGGGVNIDGDVGAGGAIIFRPKIETNYLAEYDSLSALIYGTLLADGGGEVTAYGFVWNTTPEPTPTQNIGSCVQETVEFGPFVCNLTGLSFSTTYYVRAFATNSAGTAYGAELNFTTLSQTAIYPKAITMNPTGVTDVAAVLNGEIINNADSTIFVRGFVWSTMHNPTLANSTGNISDTENESGVFSIDVTGLTPLTTYYVRAYAEHSDGISYGTEVAFTTFSIPAISVMEVSSVTDAQATANVTISFANGVLVDSVGFVLSVSSEPTLQTASNFTAHYPTVSGSFIDTFTELTAGTTYYIRAYIAQENGVIYGDEITFTTSPSPSIETTSITDSTYTTVAIQTQVLAEPGVEFLEVGFVYDDVNTLSYSENMGSVPGDSIDVNQYNARIIGLDPGTKYYLKAYVVHNSGTAYGEIDSVTTKPLPSASINPDIEVTYNTAIVNYTLNAGEEDNIVFGIVWGENQDIEKGEDNYISHTYAGTATFTDTIPNLEGITTYYVRAFAEYQDWDAEGNLSAYANYANYESFITPLPPIEVDSVYDITYNSAIAHATINSDNADINYYGFVWSIEGTPSFENKIDSIVNPAVALIEEFLGVLPSLDPSTLYKVCAFMITEIDTTYSPVFEFTTAPSPVTTYPVSEATADGAFVIGMVEVEGPVEVPLAGFTLATNETFMDTTDFPVEDFNPEQFDYLITRLFPNTTYYVRAWAEIDAKVYYGNTQSFITKSVVGTVTDASGNTYPTKYIGRYNWMTINLRTTKYSDGTDINSNDTVNPPIAPADSMGLLYSLTAVANHVTTVPNSKLCPTGWRLPNWEAWYNLLETISDQENAPALKANSGSWQAAGGITMTNTTGFSALPAGRYQFSNGVGAYSEAGERANFWSELEGYDGSYYSNYKYLDYLSNSIDNEYANHYLYQDPLYLSVRCVETGYQPVSFGYNFNAIPASNSVRVKYGISHTGYSEGGKMGIVLGTSPNPTLGDCDKSTEYDLEEIEHKIEIIEGLTQSTTYYLRQYATNEWGTKYSENYEFTTDSISSVLDIEGNKYPIITINDRVWFGENLRTNTFNNGDYVSNTGYPYYQYNNKEALGNYYQHSAVTDAHGICPTGWGVPRTEDWNDLITYLGGTSVAGKKLKDTLTTLDDTVTPSNAYWHSGGNPSLNSVDFTALPNGYYNFTAWEINDTTTNAYFWSRWLSGQDSATSIILSYDSEGVQVVNNPTNMGYNIRCIKDDPSKTYPVNVMTGEVEPISTTEVQVNGLLLDNGNLDIIRHGICYGLTENLDITGDKVESTDPVTDFKFSITGLEKDSTYYFRAFAENDYGISYGRVVTGRPVPFNGLGTEASPYQIVTIGDLVSLSENSRYWNAHFIQMIDIDASSTSEMNNGKGFLPIGNNENHFKGTYNGKDFNISNLFIDRSGETYVALFGSLYEGFLKNIHLTNVNVSGRKTESADPTTGGLIASSSFSTIDSCSVSGVVHGEGLGEFVSTGGIVGKSSADTIQNSHFSGTVSGKSNVGGLIGYTQSTDVKNCSGNANVSGESMVGGLIGQSNSSMVSACYSTGTVNTIEGENIGGLIGQISHGTYNNNYSNSSVSGGSNVGGLVGSTNDCSIAYCYSAGVVTGTTNFGGLVGTSYAVVTESYWNTETSGVTVSNGGEGKTSVEMKSQASFKGWDFTTDWSIVDGETYPFLQWQETAGEHNYSSIIQDADGNSYKTVKIYDRFWMAENLRTTKYADGTSIPKVTDNTTWENSTTAAYCWYDNDSLTNAGLYGALYNYYAADTITNGNKNLCPTGWHVSTTTDWYVLRSVLEVNGHTATGASVLKATSGWKPEIGNGTDDYGFSALPGGYRSNGFIYGATVGYWWFFQTPFAHSCNPISEGALYSDYAEKFYGASI